MRYLSGQLVYTGKRWTSTPLLPDLTDRQVEEIPSETGYQATDIVRVSIVLAEKSTVQAGYATMGIARNQEAMAYQDSLRTAQETMAQTISAQVLGGRALDVVWNLTLVGNIISANVPYGKLEEIRQLPGVEDAFVEQWYAPQTTEEADVVSPQTYISSGMTGAGLAWEQGYTGAGSRLPSSTPVRTRTTSPLTTVHSCTP